MESHRTIVTGPDGQPITEPEKDYIRRQAAELDEWAIEQGYDVDEMRLSLLMGDVEVDRLIARMLARNVDRHQGRYIDPSTELRFWFQLEYERRWPDTSIPRRNQTAHAFILRCAARAGLLRKRETK